MTEINKTIALRRKDEPQAFSHGMSIGYHGCAEQLESVLTAAITMIEGGQSVLIRGPFRVGKTTLLFRLATHFGHKPVFLDSADWALDLPPVGMVFVDEAGPLPAAFWSDVSNRMQVCAVLPDSAPRPEGWPGYTIRLDAYLPRTEDAVALLARTEKAERLLGIEGRAHHKERNELRARAERAEAKQVPWFNSDESRVLLNALVVASGEGFPWQIAGSGISTIKAVDFDALQAKLETMSYQTEPAQSCQVMTPSEQSWPLDACPARGHGLPHVVKHGETACSYCSRPMEYSGHGWLP